jgi:hypothetical protein
MQRNFIRTSIVLASTASLLCACSGRVLAPSTADGLRSEIVERTRERDAAKAQVEELQTKLLELTQARDVRIDPEAAEAMPALARVSISSLSTARLLDPNHANLAVVLVPTDGLGRFIQMTGTLRCSAFAMIPGRDTRSEGKITLGPKALRDSYRTGFMGTHYTVELPIQWDGAEPATSMSVAISFTDALTGKVFESSETVAIIKASASTSAASTSAASTSAASTSSGESR